MDKILIVAAHPDDDILGCGGYIAKHRQKNNFKVIFLAEGTTCRYSSGEIKSSNALRDIATRSSSARKALSTLGVTDVSFYDNLCGRLDQSPILHLNKIIESEIANYNPDTIFTHSEVDVNNDHRIVYRSVSMATRPGGLHHVPNLLCFETQSSTEWNFSCPFEPNYFEVLTSEMVTMKSHALECYKSEIREYPHPRSREGVETLAKYRGMQAGVCRAEAFKVIRTISE